MDELSAPQKFIAALSHCGVINQVINQPGWGPWDPLKMRTGFAHRGTAGTNSDSLEKLLTEFFVQKSQLP